MDATTKAYDAIVVGTGAAGGWAAKELTEGGMSVLALEAGRAIDPVADFPALDPVEMNMWSRIGFALKGQTVQARMTGAFGGGFSHFYVNDRENPYSHPIDAPFSWFRSRQVGGRMHTWARVAFRLSEYDLKRPDLDPELGGSWPLSYEDLEPHYTKVEETLGVIGNRDGIESPPDGHFVADPPPIPPSDVVYAKRVQEEAGIRIIRSRVIKHNPARIPIPLTMAEKTGNLTLQPDAVVHRILIDPATKQARGVGYYDRLTKRYHEATAGTVVLCASAFESVRLLLNSRCDEFPDGVGASSGTLGRYVQDHVLVPKGGVTSPEFADAVRATGEKHVPITTDPYDQGAYSMYIPNFCRTLDDKPDFIGGYGMQTSATEHTWWMMFFGQMVPSYENRVSIHPRRKDKWGIPIAHMEVRHGENELKMAAHMNQMAETIAGKLGFSLREAGGRVKRGPQALIYKLLKPMAMQKSGAMHPGAAIHETGGARMGADPSKSVLNAYCQCWDVPNVYVTDGAAFPSNGCQNHTLTIMAQTVRACQHILQQH